MSAFQCLPELPVHNKIELLIIQTLSYENTNTFVTCQRQITASYILSYTNVF